MQKIMIFMLVITFVLSAVSMYLGGGETIIYGALSLALVFVFLALFPLSFSWWWKFAIWYVPLSLLLFVYVSHQDVRRMSTYTQLFSLQPHEIYLWISSLYVLISLLLISLAAWHQRKQSRLSS